MEQIMPQTHAYATPADEHETTQDLRAAVQKSLDRRG
jgi:hypothetical protein